MLVLLVVLICIWES